MHHRPQASKTEISCPHHICCRRHPKPRQSRRNPGVGRFPKEHCNDEPPLELIVRRPPRQQGVRRLDLREVARIGREDVSDEEACGEDDDGDIGRREEAHDEDGDDEGEFDGEEDVLDGEEFTGEHEHVRRQERRGEDELVLTGEVVVDDAGRREQGGEADHGRGDEVRREHVLDAEVLGGEDARGEEVDDDEIDYDEVHGAKAPSTKKAPTAKKTAATKSAAERSTDAKAPAAKSTAPAAPEAKRRAVKDGVAVPAAARPTPPPPRHPPPRHRRARPGRRGTRTGRPGRTGPSAGSRHPHRTRAGTSRRSGRRIGGRPGRGTRAPVTAPAARAPVEPLAPVEPGLTDPAEAEVHVGTDAAYAGKEADRAPAAARPRNISEVRHFFRTNQTPIYFIGATPFNLLGLDRWVRNFSYITYYDGWDGGHPRVFSPRYKPFVEFESGEAINNWLLLNAEVRAHMTRNVPHGERPKVAMVFFDEETERICRELGYDLILPSAKRATSWIRRSRRRSSATKPVPTRCPTSSRRLTRIRS